VRYQGTLRIGYDEGRKEATMTAGAIRGLAIGAVLGLAGVIGVAAMRTGGDPGEVVQPAPVQQAAAGEELVDMMVYRNPGCGCCGNWVALAEAQGFRATVRDSLQTALLPQLGVPGQLGSCHTAIIGDYTVIGHVPIDAVQRLLREKPADIAGIAVPGMPIGSPGMEVPGRPAERYDIIAWDRQGRTRVWEQR
jgi:hypothetical protein